MLHLLGSDDPRFRTVRFGAGLNLLVADRTEASSSTDSRNGSGKSSLVELAHFLFGMQRTGNSVVGRPAVKGRDFHLELDWPRVEGPLRVTRTTGKGSTLRLHPDITSRREVREWEVSVPLDEWIELIGRDLYGLPDDHPQVNSRALMAIYARRVGQHAFNEAVRTFPQQPIAQAAANVAWLLGLDWRTAGAYQALASRESLRRQLGTAMKDPDFPLSVGSVSELRGLETAAAARVATLSEQVAAFRVVPEYEQLQARADAVDATIRLSRDADAIDRRNRDDLLVALADERPPDTKYLAAVYDELGVQLPDRVLRRFEDVRRFHATVLENRRAYLSEEVVAIDARLRERADERDQLGAQHAEFLRTLNTGGALATFTGLTDQLADARSSLDRIRSRLETAVRLDQTKAEIKAERARLQQDLIRDMSERENALSQVNSLFQRFAAALYGAGREAYMEIQPLETSLRIAPYISGEDSSGISKMVIFCFDLTLAVVAHRGGRGPDFLLHDSFLYDGVDERQIANALRLARQVCAEEGMQYIAALNSDDLSKAVRFDATLEQHTIEPRLTDAYDDGGLFGFRFE